jgi:hypothetical protein
MLGEVDVAGRHEDSSMLRKSRLVDHDRSLGENCRAFSWKDRGDGRTVGDRGDRVVMVAEIGARLMIVPWVLMIVPWVKISKLPG